VELYQEPCLLLIRQRTNALAKPADPASCLSPHLLVTKTLSLVRYLYPYVESYDDSLYNTFVALLSVGRAIPSLDKHDCVSRHESPQAKDPRKRRGNGVLPRFMVSKTGTSMLVLPRQYAGAQTSGQNNQ